MNAPVRDDRWILRSRALLDRSVQQLDRATADRLSQARLAALAPLRGARSVTWRSPLLGGLLAATAALLVALGLGWWQLPLPAEAPSSPIIAPIAAPVAVQPEDAAVQMLSLPGADLELIATTDDYALLEDLEFYAWLESDDHEG